MIRVLRGHKDSVNSIVFHGDIVISSSSDKSIKVWTSAGHLLKTLNGHNGPVSSLAVFQGDESYLVSGSWDHRIRVWDYVSGEVLRQFDHGTRVMSVTCYSSTEMMFVLSAGEDDMVKLWNSENGQALRYFLSHTLSVNRLAVTGSGSTTFLASAGADRLIGIWDLRPSYEPPLLNISHPRVLLSGHNTEITALAFSTLEGTYQLFSGGHDGTIIVWDYDEGYEIRRLEGHTMGVTGLTSIFRFESEYVLSTSLDGCLRIWNSKSPEELRRECYNPSGALLCLSRIDSYQGTRVILGGTNGFLRMAVRLEDVYVGWVDVSGRGMRVEVNRSGSVASTRQGASRLRFIHKGRVRKEDVLASNRPPKKRYTPNGTVVVETRLEGEGEEEEEEEGRANSHLLPKIIDATMLPTREPLKRSPGKTSSADHRCEKNAADSPLGTLETAHNKPSALNPLRISRPSLISRQPMASLRSTQPLKNSKENLHVTASLPTLQLTSLAAALEEMSPDGRAARDLSLAQPPPPNGSQSDNRRASARSESEMCPRGSAAAASGRGVGAGGYLHSWDRSHDGCSKNNNNAVPLQQTQNHPSLSFHQHQYQMPLSLGTASRNTHIAHLHPYRPVNTMKRALNVGVSSYKHPILGQPDNIHLSY
jgi:hypothetical protein